MVAENKMLVDMKDRYERQIADLKEQLQKQNYLTVTKSEDVPTKDSQDSMKFRVLKEKNTINHSFQQQPSTSYQTAAKLGESSGEDDELCSLENIPPNKQRNEANLTYESISDHCKKTQ